MAKLPALLPVAAARNLSTLMTLSFGGAAPVHCQLKLSSKPALTALSSFYVREGWKSVAKSAVLASTRKKLRGLTAHDGWSGDPSRKMSQVLWGINLHIAHMVPAY
ncbi:hypothetical protein HPB48_021944 [Haemaphysalis longicornis]|uniref:Uncharacterized protein n=1 Tax=Haemaphysalis longicornis TaxID=44386 RepID=A0A9J6GCW5_HAELO|nr:hypothetical protein HPB48_021944 [Haemaphysalis longicornis]